jgi:hypothetical protein
MIVLFYVQLIIHSVCFNMFGPVFVICILCLIHLFYDYTSLRTTIHLIYMCLFLIKHYPKISMCLHLIQCQILKNCVIEFQFHFVDKIINVAICMFSHYHWIHLSIICTSLYLYLKFSDIICHAGESQAQKPSLI